MFEQLDVNAMLELYESYLHANFWKNVGLGAGIPVAIIGLLLAVSAAASYDSGGGGILVLVIGVAGIVVGTRYSHIINVEIKAEVARAVVPISIDLLDDISKEVVDIYNILKGLLVK